MSSDLEYECAKRKAERTGQSTTNARLSRVINEQKRIARNNAANVYLSDFHKQLNVTLDDYNAASHGQDNVCSICGGGNNDRRLAVDHCHTTGVVRSLLCTRCNTTLGAVKEDITLLAKMIAYLGKHSIK